MTAAAQVQTPAPQPAAADSSLTGQAMSWIDDARNIGFREGERIGYVDGYHWGLACGAVGTAVVAGVLLTFYSWLSA